MKRAKPIIKKASNNDNRHNNNVKSLLYQRTTSNRDIPQDIVQITIDSKVIQIIDSAFQNCHYLTSISLHPSSQSSSSPSSPHNSYSNSSNLKKINRLAFDECTSLSSITLPSSLVEIGQGSFRFCTSLISIIIPPSVKEIGDGAFAGCESLLNVTFSCSNTTSSTNSHATTPTRPFRLGEAAFHGCTSLLSINLPSNTIIINQRAPNRRRRIQQYNNYHQNNHNNNTMNNNNNNNNNTVDYPPFEKCTMLEQAIIPLSSSSSNNNDDDNGNRIINKQEQHRLMKSWLEHRYDHLPIHQMCYQSNDNDNITLDYFQHILSSQQNSIPKTSNHHMNIPSNGSRSSNSSIDDIDLIPTTDELGLTPLHILVFNPNISPKMIQLLIDHYNDSLQMSSLPSSSLSSSILMEGKNDIRSYKAINGMTAFQMFLLYHHIPIIYDNNNSNDEKFHHSFYAECIYYVIQKGYPWRIIHSLLLLDPVCKMALTTTTQIVRSIDHNDNDDKKKGQMKTKELPLLHPSLQAATNWQCSLEVVYNLALYSIDYIICNRCD